MILMALNLKKKARFQDLFSGFHPRRQKSTRQKLKDLLPSTYFLVSIEFCPNPFFVGEFKLLML